MVGYPFHFAALGTLSFVRESSKEGSGKGEKIQEVEEKSEEKGRV